MANKEVKLNEEKEQEVKTPDTTEQTGEQIALVAAEPPKKKMGLGLKIAIGTAAAAVVAAVGLGIKCLIEALSGDDDSDPAEEESPTEE